MSYKQGPQASTNLTAAEIKDFALAEEANAKTFSTRVELIRKTIPAVLIGYGVILSYSYFVLGLGFFPSGLNLGDTLFLIFVTFGYTLLFWVIAGCGLLLMIPPWLFIGRVEVYTKKNPRPLPPPEMLIYAVVGLAITVFFSWFFFNEGGSLGDFFLRFLVPAALMLVVVALARIHGDRIGKKLRSDDEKKASDLKKGKSPETSPEGAESNPLPVAEADAKVPPKGDDVPTEESWWTVVGDILLHACMVWMGLLVSIATVYIGKDFGKVLVVTAAASGTFVALALMCLDKKQESRSKQLFKFSLGLPLFLVVLASLLPLYLDGYQGSHLLTKGIFSTLGFNAENATIVVKGDALDKIEAYKDEPGIDVDVCRTAPESAIVSGVDILWHGMGNKSFIRLGERGKPELELSASEVSLVRDNKRRCHDLRTAIFFKTGSAVPIAGEFFNDIKDEFRSLVTQRTGNWDLVQISIIGFADPQRLDKGNEALSFQRALAVKAELMEESSMDLSSERLFKLVPKGARSTDFSKCSEVSEPALRKECYEADRRVTVKLYFVRTRDLRIAH